MPFNQRDDDEDEDTTFDEVSGMADRLQLKGKQRATYIDDHMVGLGYEPVQSRDSYIRQSRHSEEEDQTPGQRWGIGAKANRSRSARNSRDDDDSF